MKTIALYNIKGGVGKTTCAVNLAYLSARAGARTLLWDLDPQGAASFYFRMHPTNLGKLKRLVRGRRKLSKLVYATDYPNLDVLPADFGYRHLDLALDRAGSSRGRLAKLLRTVRRRYDHLFLDCAPSISLVSEGVFAASDALLVPTIPTTLALRTLDQLRGHLSAEGIGHVKVMPFFSMVDRRKGLHRRIVEDGRAHGSGFLDTVIPSSSVVEHMGLRRAPLSTYASHTEADRAFRELWNEALGRLGSWLGLSAAAADRSFGS